MLLYHNIQSKPIINTSEIYETEQLLNKLKNRFSSYGYVLIKTDSFERYDLYADLNGTINKQEMIKKIDNNGQVLDLRTYVIIIFTLHIVYYNIHKTSHY